MHSREIYLFIVAFLAVMLLLTRRTEGLKPAESCKQSLYKKGGKDRDFFYGKDDKEPPLDAKKCKGLKVSRGKDKCYVSDGKTWKSSSGCKKSWMGMVDWKWAHTKGVTIGSPFRVKSADWMKYNHKSVSDDAAIMGQTDVENAQKCVDKCNEKSTECGGFSMGTKKNADGKYACWTRSNSSVQNPSTFKTKADYTLYTRKTLGTSPGSSSTTPNTNYTDCEAGKTGVTGYENSIGGKGAGKQYMWCKSAKSIGDKLNDAISHMSVPTGMSARIYENNDYTGKWKDFQTGEYNLRGLPWDDLNKSLGLLSDKLEDRASSIIIYKDHVPVY